MHVPEQPLETWRDYKDFAYDYIYDVSGGIRGQYLFRGQSNEEWPLVASFDRQFGRIEGWENIHIALLSEFGNRCQDSPELEALYKHDDRPIALAQHNGLPTRLLDWTDSPYIAAFFAFEQAIVDLVHKRRTIYDKVAIWMAFIDSDYWNQDGGVHFVKVDAWGNTKLKNQSGCFSVNTSEFLALDEYVVANDHPEPLLIKVTVPLSEARKALLDLDLMGISADRLFDTLEGKAKAAYLDIMVKLLHV